MLGETMFSTVRATPRTSHQLHRIFVVHPSELLTDHLGNGDGLAANGFLRHLAARGHELHVACERIDVRNPFPANVRLYPLGTSRIPGLAKRIVYLARARALFERLRSQVGFTIVHQLNPVFAGLSLGMTGCGVPLVLGPYVPSWPEDGRTSGMQAMTSWLRGYLRDAVVALAQREAAAVLVSSEVALRRVAPFVARDRIHHVPFGVPSALLTTAASPGAGEPLEIVFVGGLEPRKGIATLLAAFEIVVRERPSVRLRLIGTGSLLAVAEAAAAAAPPGAILIEGALARARVPEKIACADVFCAPSCGEPFGIALLEAMACGKAIVATDGGAFPYLIPEGGGLFVPMRDPKMLAAALLRVLGSAEMRACMGARNRVAVGERFTWECAIDALERAYDAAGRVG